MNESAAFWLAYFGDWLENRSMDMGIGGEAKMYGESNMETYI